ncbi:nucleotidyltransferase family protein [Amycolatopsis magusensis]|uniref:nucleotidyltransferase family protein n=1 Tax=Amycolatopsis magusensis TaxID=882444 RepID=UPI003C2EE2CC
MTVAEKDLLDTLTRVANTLTHQGIRFAVAGGFAVYARGGPPSDHDVDVLIKESDAEKASRALTETGMVPVDPPEDWLTKVYDGDILVDLIFRPNHREVTDETLDRAESMRIGATMAPVVTGTDLMTDKLLVLGPHRCDFTGLLPIARELREQVDWARVADQTRESAYARAFLMLLRELDVVEGR